jgi:predicted nucleic acid-binding protein
LKFDIRRSLRRIRPERFTAPLSRRPREALPFVPATPQAGLPLLLDICVYIDLLQGRTSAALDALLQVRTLNHLSVCVAELAHGFGRLDPSHAGTAKILKTLADTVADIPPHRLHAPRAGVVVEAGILAGLLFRLGNLPAGRELAALNDATLYLHALEHRFVVLTRNLHDFDIMNQVMPGGRMLFYDASE